MIDENITARPTEAAPARVIAHTREVNGQQLTFRGATVPEMDRYFSKAKGSLVTASIRLATDMAHDECREAAARAFAERPGVAVSIATAELEAKGFTNAEQD